jgi:hypothetical protein
MFWHSIANAEELTCKMFLERLFRGIIFVIFHFTCDLRLLAGFSKRSPGFDLGQVRVRFVVDEVALGQILLRVLRVFLVRTVLPNFRSCESSYHRHYVL